MSVDQAPTDVAAPTDPIVKTGSVARNSTVMAVGSVVSRLTGFVRTAVIGAVLSGAVIADSYHVANTLPNMVYELLIGGVLASVVVPLLVKARKTDPDGGEAYMHRLLTASTVLLAAAALLALLAAPLLTAVIVSDSAGAQEQRVVALFAYLLLPQIFFYGIAALLGAVLNTRGKFAAPMWAPIVNNIVVIGAAAVFMAMPGPAIPTAATITPEQLLVLGVGTTLGVIAQAASLWPSLRTVGFTWRWRFDFTQARLGEAARLAAWMLFYVATSQIALFVLMTLAFRAAQQGGPGPFILNNAYLLFMMMHGIVAVSVITALLPRMSAAAVEHRFGVLAENLSLGIRLSSVVLVAATAAYITLGIPLSIMAFRWGNFSSGQAHDTGVATIAAAAGLVPFAISQLQLFAFYAMRDTRTPALANLPVVGIRLALDFVVYFLLPATYVVAGLLVANAISFAVAVIINAWLLRKRIGRLGVNRIAQTITRLSLAATAAGAITWALTHGVTIALGSGKLGATIALVVGGAALLTSYIAGAIFLRVSEITETWNMIRHKVLPSLIR